MLPLRDVEIRVDVKAASIVVTVTLDEVFEGLPEFGEYGPDGFVQGSIKDEFIASDPPELEDILQLSRELRQALYFLATTQRISVTYSLVVGARALVFEMTGYTIPSGFTDNDIRNDIATYFQNEEDLVGV